MATHLQRHESDQLPGRHRLPWERLIIAMIILILAIAGIIIGIFNSHENWAVSIVVSIIFAAFTIVFVLLQLFLPLPTVTDRTSTTTSVPPLSSDTPAQSEDSKESLSTYARIMQQRQKVVDEIYTILTRSDVTAVVLTGIGGVGKSTLATLLYRYIEKLRQSGEGFFTAQPIWLTVDTSYRMADLVEGVFEALGKHLPDLNGLTPQKQAVVLINALNTTDRARLIILDQFENLLDWQTGYALPERPGIREWLDLINSQQCTCRILLTSRSWPQETREHLPMYMQEFQVKGLEMTEGIELLQELGVEETEAKLQTAVAYCDGHPLALMLLASLLRDYHISITAFFNDPLYAKLWVGDIAHNLLDHIYMQRLTEKQQTLLVAFSIYREAIPLEAALALLNIDAQLTMVQVQSALDSLLAQHLLQEFGNNRNELAKKLYRVHTVVANYARDHYINGEQLSNQQALQNAHMRAAQYYLSEAAKNCPPREKRRRINDVRPLLEAIWHLSQASQWQEAYDLVERESIFIDLKRWGGNDILLELFLQLLPLTDSLPKSLQAVTIYQYLGRVHRTLGQRERALEYLEKALSICQEIEDHKGEGTMHSFLGSVFADLGKPEQALEHLGLALKIRRQIGDREGEGWTLNNLGRVYNDLGQEEQAQEYLEQALKIRKEVGDRRGEERTLTVLGRIYDIIGRKKLARQYYEQASNICIEIGDRLGEGMSLKGLGLMYADMGQKDQARAYLEQALLIRQEVSDRGGEARTLNHLSRVYRLLRQHDEAQERIKQGLSISREITDRLGESRMLNNLALVLHDQGEDKQALQYLENALSLSEEVGNRNTMGWTLHNLGRIYTALKNKKEAQKYYKQALQIRLEVRDRRGEGWTLLNIGILHFEQRHYELALACYLRAKFIFEEVQSPDCNLPQAHIDRLHKELTEEQFTALLAAVEPNTQAIIKQALQENP